MNTKTVGQLIDRLKELIDQGVITRDTQVIYSKDTEGNGFSSIYYDATPGHFDGWEFADTKNTKEKTNCVCVN